METAFSARVGSIIRLISWLCFIAAVSFSPWRFGGVFASDQLWIVTLLAASGLGLMLAAAVRNGTWPRLPKTTWPLLAAAVLGAAQLVPISAALHQRISPQGLEWWKSLTSDGTPNWDEPSPISLYPASTRHDLALLGIGVAAFLIANSFSRERNYLLWTLIVVAVNGAATSLFGIAELLTSNGKLYWTIPLTQGGTPFAAFVNRNHAAGYLNLCLAASLGLFIYVLAGRQSADSAALGNHNTVWDDEDRRSQAWSVILIGALCALVATAVVCTMSRGGVLAGVVGLLVTAAVTKTLRQAKSFRRLVAVICCAAVATACWLGRGLSLQHRFEELWSEAGLPSNGRLAHWADALQACRDFWLTGTGFGTYRFAYRPYETAYQDGWYFHAENQYLEALLEGGLPGVCLLIVAWLLAWRAVHRRRREPDRVSIAIGTAGIFALTAQGTHACFDFGLYLPANALLFGLLAGCASRARESTTTEVSTLPWVLVGGGLICWLGFGWIELRQVHYFEQQRSQFSDAVAALPDDLTVIDRLVPNRLSAENDFAESRLLAADIWLSHYRVSAFQRLTQASPASDRQLIWTVSDPRTLHQRCHEMLAAGQSQRFAQLREDPVMKLPMEAAYEELMAARRACPLLPRVHLGLAQLGVIMGDAECEELRLEHAQLVAPFAPGILFQTGLLDLQAGRTEAGFAKWSRCLLLSPRFIDQVMQLATRVIGTNELIDRVLPRSPERLVQIADRYFQSAEASANRMRLANKAESALADSAQLAPAKQLAIQGHIHRLRDEQEDAIRALSAAVALAPGDVTARFELAQLLTATHQLREAQHHATICQRLDPGPSKYAALLQRIRGLLLDDLRS